MVRKTKEEAAATRESILDAAVRIFAEKGVSQATFHDIASAAGLTRGAIYWHFGDKDALFEALMTERATQPLEEALHRLDRGASIDPLHALSRHMLALLRAVARDGRLQQVFELALLKVEFPDRADVVRHWHRRAMQIWTAHARRHIEAARQCGLARAAIHPGSAAQATWVMIHGLIRSWLVDPAGIDLLEQGRCLFGLFIDGLRADADAATEGQPPP